MALVSAAVGAQTAETGRIAATKRLAAAELPPEPAASEPAAAAAASAPVTQAVSRTVNVPGAEAAASAPSVAAAAVAAPPVASVAPDNAAVAAASAAAAASRGGQRLALVIGNNAYRDAPLLNPANDARGVAEALQSTGFTVILKVDANLLEMQAAVREFGDKLRQGGGTGLFYFAGHGMQIKGRNHLIPVGADIQREDEVAYHSMDAQSVLDKMESAGNGTNLMILDACRNNPFLRSFRSAAQGLAQMDAPVGTMVAFSTAPGSVSSDGIGAHGLYTEHLLRALQTPGIKVEDVFKQVRSSVRRESQGKQIPWESTSLEGDFYFQPPAGGAVALAQPQPVAYTAPTPVAPPADTGVDEAFWSAISRVNQAGAYEAYMRRFPTGLHASEALTRMVAIASSGSGSSRESPDPTRNMYGYTVGDQWEFEVIDRWTDAKVGRYTVEVAEVNEDGSLETNGGGLMDGHARWKKMVGVPGVPTRVYAPFQPSWWDGAVTSATNSMTYQITEGSGAGTTTYIVEADSVVKGPEQVKVPAGSFKAQRIVVSAFAKVMRGGSRVATERWETVYWYVPELRNYVAMEHDSRDVGTGRLVRRDREELLSYNAQSRSAPGQQAQR